MEAISFCYCRYAYPSLFLFQIHLNIHANKCDCAYRGAEMSQGHSSLLGKCHIVIVLFWGNNGSRSSDHYGLMSASIVSQNLTLCLGILFCY